MPRVGKKRDCKSAAVVKNEQQVKDEDLSNSTSSTSSKRKVAPSTSPSTQKKRPKTKSQRDQDSSEKDDAQSSSTSDSNVNSSRKPRTKPCSEVWALITDETSSSVATAHTAAIIICRFCFCEVHTSRKANRAIAHLKNRCQQGKAFLNRSVISHYIS
jgi:hypothetical protein